MVDGYAITRWEACDHSFSSKRVVAVGMMAHLQIQAEVQAKVKIPAQS
jgi:hypothetical protein